MKEIIKNNTIIFNSDKTLEEYKKQIIKAQNEVKKAWKNYYKLINKK